MSNPYECFVCHNEGYDHAPDCPFNPANMPDDHTPPPAGRPAERTPTSEETGDE